MIKAKTSTIQHRHFLGCQIVDHVTAQPLGRVSDIWIDLSNHEVLGFNCRAGFWDLNPRTYPLRQIRQIDDQQMTVEVTPEANPALMMNLQPEISMTTGDRINLDVWTQRGQWLGEVTDYSFDPGSGAISDYSCTDKKRNGAVQQQFKVPASAILDAGCGWLLVSEPVPESTDLKLKEWFLPILLAG